MQTALTKYLDHLDSNPDGNEVEYRTPFENFFNEFTKEQGIKATIKQEDRHGVKTKGIPDFAVYDNSEPKKFVGYIECKKPNTNLDKIKDSEQIKEYQKTTNNIILTDYHRFILLGKDSAEHDVVLSKEHQSVIRFQNLLKDFYSYNYPHIKTKKVLATILADQSFHYSGELRKFIKDKENETENFYTKFNGLFKEYEKSISYYYALEDFCDIYSQSLVYGLMLARIDTNKDLDEEGLNYLQDIPEEYKLLYEFLSQAYESRFLPTSLKRALISIGKNINMIDTEAIQQEFSKTGEGKQHIAVYLYEDFLQAYDNLKKTEKRKESGVYYTPVEAANFITRAVNEIIKTKFDPKGYLADKVKVLDFACGTGTFLHSVFEQMLEPLEKGEPSEKGGSKLDAVRKEEIKNKITKDIFGFELLFVPYIISHTILTRFLKGEGINLKKRLGIFLTNTLDISQHKISDLLPNLKKEYEKAMDIKEKEHILAIIGNPPYFVGRSQAKKGVIDDHLKEYKKDLNEQNIMPLNDIYLKFIRFAEWKIEKQEQGIIGIITNNSYIDGITHRQMRKHLYETFDEIYIVNLHGNTRRKEGDKNIFDVMVGVAIAIFVKLPKPTNKKVMKYFSTMDNKLITRPEKLDFLNNIKFKNVKWKTLKPVEPYYWFVDKDFSLQDEYNRFWKLINIFENYSSGVKTKKDAITIHYNKRNLDKVITDFINLSEQDIATKYKLDNSSRDWKISYAKNDLIANKGKDFYSYISYRPFDNRITYFTGKTKGFHAFPTLINSRFVKNENIGLCFTRNIDNDNFSDVFIADKSIDVHVVGGQNYLAPLYLYKDGEVFDGASKTPNFTVEFSAFLKTLDFKPRPEKILAYIYAILHSPIYRKKYVEFLKTDFPAIPFTKDKTIFEKYVKLGQKLIDLHLLKDIPDDKTIKLPKELDFPFTIDKITYTDNKLLLHTTENKIITIEGITKEIYGFEIGSYKPIDKWLKYRKKDSVPLESKDLKHIKDMAVAIKNTIPVMEEIAELCEEYLH